MCASAGLLREGRGGRAHRSRGLRGMNVSSCASRPCRSPHSARNGSVPESAGTQGTGSLPRTLQWAYKALHWSGRRRGGGVLMSKVALCKQLKKGGLFQAWGMKGRRRTIEGLDSSASSTPSVTASSPAAPAFSSISLRCRSAPCSAVLICGPRDFSTVFGEN